MRTDKLKKYLLPNLPYLFIGWACLKVGTAYRLAAGADLAHKLVGMVAALGPAFADFAPGLAPFDWLTGIAGAVAIRLIIYQKSKKPKNTAGMKSMVRPAGERKKTSSRSPTPSLRTTSF